MPDEVTDSSATPAPVAQETARESIPQSSAPEASPAPETAQTPPDPSQQQLPTQPDGQQQANQPPTENKWDSPENPYYKRFNDVQPVASRLFQEVKAYKDLGVDPATIRQMIDERKQREQASNLKPWNAGHSDYNKFKQLRSTANEFRSAMQRAGQDPVKQEFVKEMYQGKFSGEDLQMIQQAETERQEQLEQLQSDPAGFIAQHVDSLIQQKFQQYEQFQNTRQQVTGWFNDPNNQPLVQKYSQDMAQMMDPSIPARDKAVAYAQMKAQVDQLRAQLSQTATQSVQQNARQDLLGKGQRQSHRIPNQQRQDVGDPVKYLIGKGFKEGTTEFAVQLERLNKR